MKRTRLFTALIIFLSIMLLTPMTHAATSGQTKFKDVPSSNEFHDYITHLVEIGAIKGYANGTFKPNNNVSRQHAAKIITEALNMPLKNPKTPTFKDIPRNHDYYKHIETLAAHDIIGGYPDKTFRPGKNLKRSHMAKIISKSMKLTKQSNKNFSDVPKKDEFYPYVDKLVSIDITKSFPKFNPNKNVTRGQMAAFISRGLDNWLSSDDITFDKGLKLGMTQEQVIAIEGKPTARDENTMEYAWVPLGDLGAELLLYFSNNKLDHIIIYINTEKEGITAKNSEDFFEFVVEMIYKPKFGNPTDTKYKWEGWEGHETLYADWSLGKGVYYNVEMGEDDKGGYFFATTKWGSN